MLQSLLISTETWHRHLCIFSPRSAICPSYTHTHSPSSFLQATTSLSWGLCCGALGECHPTNEFLLTTLSPLKNLFVLLQQLAVLPCSCFCSQTQVLVIYIPLCCVYSGDLHLMHRTATPILSFHNGLFDRILFVWNYCFLTIWYFILSNQCEGMLPPECRRCSADNTSWGSTALQHTNHTSLIPIPL